MQTDYVLLVCVESRVVLVLMYPSTDHHHFHRHCLQMLDHHLSLRYPAWDPSHSYDLCYNLYYDSMDA